MVHPQAQSAKEKGNQCFNSGNTEGSIKHYEAALAIQRAPPNDDESSGHIDFITAVLTNLALAHSKMGKFATAESLCNEALSHKPQNPKLLYRRACARMKQKKLDGAHEDIMLAAKISPEDGAIQKAQQMIQKKWQQWKTTTELDSAAQRNSDQKHDALVNPTRTSKKKKNRRKSPLSRELKNSRQVEESPKNVNPRHVVKLHFTPLTPDKNRIQHPMETHPRPASTTALDLQNERATLVAMPLPAKQRIIISSLIKQADARGLQLGDTWFLVALKWWKRWCIYVQYDGKNEDKDPIKPSKINNKALLAPNVNEMDGESAPLFPNLIEGRHFTLVPEEAFAALIDWYGGGPAIGRSVVSINPNPSGDDVEEDDTPHFSQLRVELYPELVLKFAKVEIEAKRSSSARIGVSVDHCTSCGKRGARRCTQCNDVSYCGRTCQEAHWKYHKQSCKSKKGRAEGNSTNVIDVPMSRNGKVGLSNLGNTCFMNSALQCLSHTEILTRHFVSDKYAEDLNQDNPLGTGGRLAKAYATLLKDLWFGTSSSITPSTLKRAISRFAPQFSGFQQHDSQELIAYLLDGLHEDCNRVLEKSYIETKDDDGRPDDVVANEAWGNHLKRNRSIFVDHIQGQFKSKVVCPKCQKVSVTYDPFNCIQLELPVQAKQRSIAIKFVRRLSSIRKKTSATRYTLEVDKKGTIGDLLAKLSPLTGLPTDRMLVTDIYNHLMYRHFLEKHPVAKIRDDDNIVVYEILPPEEVDGYVCVVHRDSGPKDDHTCQGTPLLLSIVSGQSMRSFIQDLWIQCTPFFELDTDMSDETPLQTVLNHYTEKFEQRVVVVNKNGIDELDEDDQPLFLPLSSKMSARDMQESDPSRLTYLAIQWHEGLLKDRLNVLALEKETCHASVLETRKKKQTGITLKDCFENFTSPELLDPDNLWYCSKCKAHQRATKTLSIWKAPDILILSLKRFEYRNILYRDKIDCHVDFPIDALDLSTYCLSHVQGHEPDKMIYDLYAIDNHYGRMGFGHYTAFARKLDTKTRDDWYHFDDSHVSSVRSSEVKTNAAYILFYQRRKSSS